MFLYLYCIIVHCKKVQLFIKETKNKFDIESFTIVHSSEMEDDSARSFTKICS